MSTNPPLRGPLSPRRLVALILAAVLTVVFGATVVLPGDPATSPATTPVVVPAKVDADHSSDNEPAGPSVAAHEDLKDEFPAGASDTAQEKGLQQQSAPGITGPKAVGGAQNYSCPAQLVRNRSGRGGQTPLLFVVHLTVSGPGSGPAILRLFDTPSFSASSTYLAELTTRWCRQLVPESQKPWTQGNFNGRSISIEIVARGTETRSQWLAGTLIKDGRLASLMYDSMRRNGIPIRWVDPVGCTVQKAGWTDHNALECGNNHTDVQPNFPYDVVKQQLARLAAGQGKAAAARGKTCNQLRYHRGRLKAKVDDTDAERKARVARINRLKRTASAIGLNEAKCRA